MFELFPLGHIVATPGALVALERAKQPATCFLDRHAIGDWGELEPADVAENEYSVDHGFRLVSSYQTDAGERLWIITEADRSATTDSIHTFFRQLLMSRCADQSTAWSGIDFIFGQSVFQFAFPGRNLSCNRH
jgi:hypothetical protein